MQLHTFSITLEQAYMITPKVKHFVFHSDQSPAFDYRPGQFITLHFEHEGKNLKRSYSIANAPMGENRIEFAAGFIENGPGSKLLFNLQPGDTLNVNGPFGRLLLKDEDPKRYVLVATSTGVTPYRAMLKDLEQRLQNNPDLQVVILQGVQKKADLLYGDEFLALAKKYPRLQFRPYFSRETENNLQAGEYAGYVQTAFPELMLNQDEDIVYLCGNPGMIDESFEYLKNQGFTIQRIVREKYISN